MKILFFKRSSKIEHKKLTYEPKHITYILKYICEYIKKNKGYIQIIKIISDNINIKKYIKYLLLKNINCKKTKRYKKNINILLAEAYNLLPEHVLSVTDKYINLIEM